MLKPTNEEKHLRCIRRFRRATEEWAESMVCMIETATPLDSKGERFKEDVVALCRLELKQLFALAPGFLDILPSTKE